MYENLALTLKLGQFVLRIQLIAKKKKNELNGVFRSLKNEKLGSVSFKKWNPFLFTLQKQMNVRTTDHLAKADKR